MNFYDDQSKTVRELFEEFFPGRDDVVRLLMEPITYANGSTLEDPAITYGIVFSNFMQKGVYTFEGGTDKLIGQIRDELVKNGVDVRIRCLVEKIEVDAGPPGLRRDRQRAAHRRPGGRLQRQPQDDGAQARRDRSISIPSFVEETRAVRLNNSSCQVYMALKPGVGFDYRGDLLFHSEHRGFDIDAMLSRNVSSRTFSFYYPEHAAGQRPLCRRVVDQRQLLRLGLPLGRRVRRDRSATSNKRRSTAWSVTFRESAKKSTTSKRPRREPSNITRGTCRGPRSARSSRDSKSASRSRSRFPACSTRARWELLCRAGWGR